jgi:Bacterial protein of unknown function (DUF853)
MGTPSGVGGGPVGPWYRVQAITASSLGGTAERDYASVLPAVLNAALHRRPFVAGWLSRGGGAPLELITNAGPLPPPDGTDSPDLAGPQELLFPWGARGVLIADSMLADLDSLVWAPCPVRQALVFGDPGPGRGARAGQHGPASGPGSGEPGHDLGHGRQQPTTFESALVTLMPRRFGWLVVADPADLIDAETADLRTQLNALRRYEEEHARFDVERAERRLAELDACREAGLWNVRVLAGAATEEDLRLIAPVLVGSLDLRAHPYRLRSATEAHELADALGAKLADPADGAQVPFAATAGVLAALTGLPRGEVPGVRVIDLGYFDVTSETDADISVGQPDGTDSAGRPDGAESAAAAEKPDGADAGKPGGAEGKSGEKPAGAEEGKAEEKTEGKAEDKVGQAEDKTAKAEDKTGKTEDKTGKTEGDAESAAAKRPAKDATPAVRAIELGAILDGQDRPVGSFRVPLATLNRHAFVTGATGAGKSQTVRHLLEQLTRAGIPWLAIEPVKSEYQAMAGRIAGFGQVTVINPSDPAAVPLSVNPLAPEPGYPVQAHIDMVRALFLAAFDAREPFPQIISQALQRAYEDCGWDPVTGAGRPGAAADPAVPTLARLQRAALEVIEDVGYGEELRADVRGFVEVRLRSLRTGSAGRFFEGGHPADVSELLRRNVVLSIEDVANDEDKALAIGTLIIRIVEHLRLRNRARPAAGLQHVIVIEEAHRLLRASREGASAHAVELFASLLAEIRAYGEGIVVAEQIPAKLVPDVVKNTALKILHRLPAADDRQTVGAAMNLDDDQSRQVVSLRPGVAAVFADGMDRPLRIAVPFGGAREQAATAEDAPEAPITGRRSPACGPTCAAEGACTLLQLRAADLLAASPDDAWLRVWVEALLLAFLTNSPLPVVPAPLRQRWGGLDPRLRECLLACVLDRALHGRAQALRSCYGPERLAQTAAVTALALLDGELRAGSRPGPKWVIPQLQWLHEIERVCPLGGAPPDPFADAPALDFKLPGLVDRPGIRLGQRVTGLRRHPLSMELSRNQQPAWAVLLGEDDQRGFIDDLAAITIGVSHRGQLRKAAGEMGIAGWLEAVLSWPRRFIVGRDERAADPAATRAAGSAAALPGADAVAAGGLAADSAAGDGLAADGLAGDGLDTGPGAGLAAEPGVVDGLAAEPAVADPHPGG